MLNLLPTKILTNTNEQESDQYIEQPDPYKAWRTEVHKLNLSKAKWQSRVACRKAKPGTMYPVRNDAQQKVAELYCTKCEMQVDCLYFALVAKEEFGVWGGTTESQRVEIQKSIVKDGHGTYRTQWNSEHEEYFQHLASSLGT